ncbi:hypothetical protein SAMN04487962_1481 [Marinobacter segnicrescens]|uniref:Uncharacterized protein n=1 Tax=Marinobacter segnicrescens TaxID=430453 RepID=A0A1I0I8S5_9GAMM|nr:hypothetical protein [Marinobacter segnicrescens]SET92779.1 hypothetical protein SAMN04487962_1481 [Marinobacter segnicrescens]
MSKRKTVTSRIINYVPTVLINTIFLSGSFVAHAEDETRFQQARNSAEPTRAHQAELEIPGVKKLRIHREASSQATDNVAVYYHRPIFALQENPEFKEKEMGHPLIWDNKQDDSGDYYLRFRIALSTKSIMQDAEAAVINQDHALKAKKPNVSINDIKVRPWPIKALRLTFQDDVLPTQYGQTSRIFPLSDAEAIIDHIIKVPEAMYEPFINALSDNDVQFQAEYSYNNIVDSFASSSVTISNDLEVRVENALQSAQLKSEEPIFQSDIANFLSALNTQMTQNIRANDADLIRQVAISSADLMNLVIKPDTKSFSELRETPDLLKKVEDYLQAIATEKGWEKSEETSKADTNRSESAREVEFKPNTPSVKLTEKDISELKNEHKLTLKENEKTKTLEPHEIEISYINSGWQNSLAQITMSAYVAKGTIEGLERDDKPIPSSFTLSRLKELMPRVLESIAPFAGVPQGAAFCYFGAEIPKGFIRLDGAYTLPDENWVHESLKGKNVPNMEGAYARGAKPQEGLGGKQQGGQITITAENISDDLRLKQSGNINTLNLTGRIQTYLLKYDDGGARPEGDTNWVVNDSVTAGATSTRFIANGKRNLPPLPALISSSVPYFDGIVGNIQKIEIDTFQPQNQPPHITCQWIMRIN